VRKAALLLILALVAVVGVWWSLRDDPADRPRPRRGATAGAPSASGRDAGAAETKAGEDAESRWIARLRLLDEQRRPVAGATVGHYVEQAFLGETVRSDAEGRCRVSLPAQPWVSVGVRHPDYIFREQWLPSGSEREVEITLYRGAPLAVVVLTPQKEPVAGAQVTAARTLRQGAAGIWSWSMTLRYGHATTDDEGRAVLGGMPPVDVGIVVDHPRYAIHTSRVAVRGEAPIEHLVVLDAGGVLEGRVLDLAGRGVEGAEVRLRSGVRPTTHSGADGAFRLAGVGAGTVEVVAVADGYGPGFFGERLGWGDPVPIRLRAGDTLTGIEITLGPATHVLGRIVDDAKRPVRGVDVQGWISNALALDRRTRSDEEGRFRLGPFTLRQSGSVTVWFEAGEHLIEQVHDKTAEPGRDLDLGTVKATRRAIVRGVVLDVDGTAAADAIVSARFDWRSVRVKQDGTFDFTGAGPGKVFLQAGAFQPEPRVSVPLALEVAAGEVREGVELRLLPARSIQGRVITPDGKPRMQALLAIQPLDFEEPEDPRGYTTDTRARSDREGRFVFENLPHGRYRVGIQGSGSSWSSKVEFLKEPAPRIVEAGAADLEFVFPLAGAVVVGKVVSKHDGLPIRGFNATFIRYRLFLPTDTDFHSYQGGRFQAELAEPGTWQVDISADGYASHRTPRFEVAAGEVKDLGTIRLGDGGTIAGRVRDAQGRPVPYARINVLNAKLQTNDEEPYTDLEGRFELEGISPDIYTVFAISPRHPLGMVRNVSVREGERTEVDVGFLAPAPLTVAVVDSGGNPVPGAELYFTFPAIAPLNSKLFQSKIPPGYGSHEAGADGLIHQHSLPPGAVTITVEAEGFVPRTRNLRLEPGEPNRVEILLRSKPG
jgi:protocatechuate 3,4-dioxygenase beta subunit